MKYFAVLCAVCALCAIAFADPAPDELLPCAFRLTAHAVVKSTDGTELATSINEMLHDNGNWVWKSQFNGSDFIQAFLPNHEWVITWRQDLKKVFRHDMHTKKCTIEKDIPTPYEWIESKTYGIAWFDEPVEYEGQEATLYTAVAAGSRAGYDFEAVAGFYVLNKNFNLVHFNGTVTAAHKEIDVIIETTSVSFEHNKRVDPKSFVLNKPCEEHEAPADPSADFMKKCYNATNGASLAGMSWLALIVAILAALLHF